LKNFLKIQMGNEVFQHKIKKIRDENYILFKISTYMESFIKYILNILIKDYLNKKLISEQLIFNLENVFFKNLQIKYLGQDIERKKFRNYFGDSIREMYQKLGISIFMKELDSPNFSKLDFYFHDYFNIDIYNTKFGELHSKLIKNNRNSLAHGGIFDFGKVNISVSLKDALFLFSQ